MQIYLSIWIAACILATTFAVRKRNILAIFSSRYVQFLLPPWKVTTFLVAAASLVVMAPYTGDSTWDYIDAAFMSLLTFWTAPYSVGVIARKFKGRGEFDETLFAVCLWLFSASWSYDAYLLLRDGSYPSTWAANLAASSILYFFAGILWNLEWSATDGSCIESCGTVSAHDQ